MPTKGFTWNEEYRKKFYSSEKVQEHLDNFVKQASKPKSKEQKTKMSIAKSGRKYTQEHKDNMRDTQRYRQLLRKEIETNQPNLSKEKVWELVRERMEQE